MTIKEAKKLRIGVDKVMWGDCGPFTFHGIAHDLPCHCRVEDEPGHLDALLTENLTPVDRKSRRKRHHS